MSGAVDLDACSNGRSWGGLWKCGCAKCSICGHPKHSAVHGPVMGRLPGTKPWGHSYKDAAMPTGSETK